MAIGFILNQQFVQTDIQTQKFKLSHLRVKSRQVAILSEGSESAPVRKYWALSCMGAVQTQDDSRQNALYGLFKRKNWLELVRLNGTTFVPVEKAVQLTRSGELSTV
jgi:hypothetical protein